ncbi:MAG: sodium:solute symporter family protein [Tissierellia bacterium]|nr:sodium:solute symporter family protein [Tissierellia bacterium]
MVSFLDWIVIIGYMLAMVGIGVYFKTSESLSSFAIADKKLGLSVLTATLLATAVGGGSLTGGVGNSFASGLIEAPKVIILLGINIFMGLFVAKKMRDVGGFTAPEMLGRVYGKNCQFIGGIFCSIYMMGAGPAMQSIALGSCIHVMLGIDMKLGMIIGMILILAYTLTSGMWGVAMTDYVQFIFLTLGVLITTFFIFKDAGGWESISSNVPAEHLKVDTTGALKIIAATSLPVLIDGNRYARFYSAKDGNTARLGTLIASIPQSLLIILTIVLGMAAVNLLPADTHKDVVFSTLLLNYLPSGIKGICIAALIAAIMSTADSYMLTGATNFSVDIYKTKINPNASDKQMLIVTKIGVLAIGLIGLGFALVLPDIMSVWTLSSTAYVGGCLVPMLYGIFFNKKKSYKAALIAMLCGGTLALVLDMKGFVFLGLPAIVYGVILSAILLFAITPFAKDAKYVDVRNK